MTGSVLWLFWWRVGWGGEGVSRWEGVGDTVCSQNQTSGTKEQILKAKPAVKQHNGFSLICAHGNAKQVHTDTHKKTTHAHEPFLALARGAVPPSHAEHPLGLVSFTSHLHPPLRSVFDLTPPTCRHHAAQEARQRATLSSWSGTLGNKKGNMM